MRLDSLPGWQVTTTIRPAVRAALLLGQYKLIGGVIQEVPSVVQGGQIIRLLIPLNASPRAVMPKILSYQISPLQPLQASQKGELITTSDVLQSVTDMMNVTGLNVAMIPIDLPTIYKELSRFEKLQEIQEDVKQTRVLLERIQRAELRVSIHKLLDIDQDSTLDSRQSVLEETRQILAKMNQRAGNVLIQANTIESAMEIEPYFILTGLGRSRCTAELGLLDVAHQEIKEMVSSWRRQSQRIATYFWLGDHPERFLFSDFVQHLPTSTLVEWLNFAHGEEKGLLWLDELRRKTKPWYTKSSIKSLFAQEEKGSPKSDKQIILPAMQKLVAKNTIMNGYIAQYEFLKEHQVTVSELQKEIYSLGENAAVNGIVILEPVSN